MNSVRRARAWWKGLPPWVPDGALAVLLAAVELSLLWIVGPSDVRVPDFAGPTPAAIAVVCLMTLPVAVRRRYPLGVFAAIAVGTGLSVLLAVPTQLYGLLVALYTVAAHCARRWSLAAVGVALVGAGAGLLALDALRFLPVTALMLVTAWILGDRQRTRRAYMAELEARATRLEQERQDHARLAVAEERSRIAREFHDVIAHAVSVMVVQTAAARRTLARDPALAEGPLEQVEATGRQALVDLRRLLGVLHSNGDRPELAPQPGVAQLDEVVDEARETGLAVILTVEGEPRPLPSAVDLSVYRIVQEALTNVRKHAGPVTNATVSLSYEDRAVRLEIADDGRGPVPENLEDARGHGLVGIRERVSLLGGSLHVGARPGGGFLVRAVLPLDDSRTRHAVSGGAV